MAISEADALQILPLAVAKSELRIPPYSPPPTPTDPTEAAEEAEEAAREAAHDSFLSGQIRSAVEFVMESTGADLAELPTMRPSIVSAVRTMYDGRHEITRDAAHNVWMQPFRSY